MVGKEYAQEVGREKVKKQPEENYLQEQKRAMGRLINNKQARLTKQKEAPTNANDN